MPTKHGASFEKNGNSCARRNFAHDDIAGGVDAVNLKNALGQIHADCAISIADGALCSWSFDDNHTLAL